MNIFGLWGNESINNQVVDYKDAPISKLPIDVLVEKIFATLSLRDIYSCIRVCRKWRDLTDRKGLWRTYLFNNYRYDVIDDFSSLVANEVLTWKEALFFSPLSDFFAKVSSDRNSLSAKIRNEEIDKNVFAQGNCKIYMPKSFIRFGNITFAVVDSTNVEIKRNDSNKVQILEGEKGIRLTHLAVEGPYLFTLRIDGIIIQWDYQKGEVVQKIQTAFAKGNRQLISLKAKMASEKLTRGIEASICENSGSFLVKNGLIALKYRAGLGISTMCEIINYVNPNESQILNVVPFGELMIKQNKLFSFCDIHFSVFDLVTNEKHFFNYIESYRRIQDIDLVNNVLCGTRTDWIILLFDHISGNELKSFKIEDCPRIITMIGNLLIGFSYKEIPNVIDLNTEQRIDNIPDLFCYNNNTINIGAFARLINICRANLGTVKPPQSGWCSIV